MASMITACTVCMGAPEGASGAGINAAIFVLLGVSLTALAVVGWAGWRVARFERERSHGDIRPTGGDAP